MFTEALRRYRKTLAHHQEMIAREEDPKKKEQLLKEYSAYTVKAIEELIGMAEEEDIPILEQAANQTAKGIDLDLFLNQQINRKFGKESRKVEKIESCPKCKTRLINDEPHQC